MGFALYARMDLFKSLLVSVSLLLAVPSYSADPSVCSLVLQTLTRSITAPIARARTISEVRHRLRAVLGPLFPEMKNVKVVNRTCLYRRGCAYDPIWNVIQMDNSGLLRDNWAYGVVYGHELVHSIDANQNPILVKARQGTDRLRRSYLRGWSKIHTLTRRMQEPNVVGLWYLLSNAEARVYELSERLSKLDDNYSEKYKLLYTQASSDDRNWSAIGVLKTSAGELFADLASNAAHSDGNAIARALERIDGRKHEDRENPRYAMMPDKSNVNEVSLFQKDVHTLLRDARQVIWDRYLRGKSDAAAQRVFAALKLGEQNWLEQASSLLTRAEWDHTTPRKPPEEELWQIDNNRLNHLFIEVFESFYLPLNESH